MSDADPASVHEDLYGEVSKVLIGNETVFERLLIALLTDGHVLLEGVPGVAKTTLAELFARATGMEYSRIQLTPDSLPADITGTTIYREATGEFEVQKGPVFANVVVADEINRATPKTQSALLEAMQEQQVTIDGSSLPLPDPFLLIATQNPIEMGGTFELPEAQRDRFQFKLRMGIPDRADETKLLGRFDDQPNLDVTDVSEVIGLDQIAALQDRVATVHVAPPVREFLLDILVALREHPSVDHGPSPRSGIALQDAAKAQATLRSRRYVIPDDLKTLAPPVLAHRLVLATDATLGEVDPAAIVTEATEGVEPPSASDLGPEPEGTDQGPATSDGGEIE